MMHLKVKKEESAETTGVKVEECLVNESIMTPTFINDYYDSSNYFAPTPWVDHVYPSEEDDQAPSFVNMPTVDNVLAAHDASVAPPSFEMGNAPPSHFPPLCEFGANDNMFHDGHLSTPCCAKTNFPLDCCPPNAPINGGWAWGVPVLCHHDAAPYYGAQLPHPPPPPGLFYPTPAPSPSHPHLATPLPSVHTSANITTLQ